MAIDLSAANKRVMARRSEKIKNAVEKEKAIGKRSQEIRQEVTRYFGGKFGNIEQAPHTETNKNGIIISHKGKSIQIDVNDDGTFTVKDEESRVHGRESGTLKEKLSDEELSEAIYEFIYPEE